MKLKIAALSLVSLISTVSFAGDGSDLSLNDQPILGSRASRKGGTLNFNLSVAPATLNPITSHDNFSAAVLPWISETLLTHHEETYRWVSGLAENFQISKDNLVFTFQLRQGVLFHDGHEMTADDIQFSFQVYGMDLYKAAGDMPALANIEKIEILGRYQIRFTMKTAKFNNIDLLASVVIVPKSIYGDKEQISKLSKTTVGTGPYRVKEYLIGERLVLEANPSWWGRNLSRNRYKYNFANINIRFITEQATTLMHLEKGDLDYSPLKPEVFIQETHGPAWGSKVFSEHPQFAATYTTQNSLFLNLRLPIFRDARVRLALQKLLDRDWLNQKMLGGRSMLATGPWHRLSEYADPTVQPVLFDPKAAATLLRESGWEDSDHDGILDKLVDGKKMDFHFTLMIAKRDLEKFLINYQNELKKIGIVMEIKTTDWTLFVKSLDDLNFDAYIVGRGFPGVVDFNPKYEWSSRYTKKGSDNNIGYSNPEVDALLDRAEVEFDRKKRIQLLRRAYRVIAEDSSQIFWFSDPETYYAHTARLKFDRAGYKYLESLNYAWIDEP